MGDLVATVNDRCKLYPHVLLRQAQVAPNTGPQCLAREVPYRLGYPVRLLETAPTELGPNLTVEPLLVVWIKQPLSDNSQWYGKAGKCWCLLPCASVNLQHPKPRKLVDILIERTDRQHQLGPQKVRKVYGVSRLAYKDAIDAAKVADTGDVSSELVKSSLHYWSTLRRDPS